MASSVCSRTSAQNTTPTPATLAEFAAWLTANQQHALDGMRAEQGAAFAQHADAFNKLSTAIDALHQFELEAIKAAVKSGGAA